MALNFNNYQRHAAPRSPVRRDTTPRHQARADERRGAIRIGAGAGVHNDRVPQTGIGAVAVAVPSLDAALAGMLDTHRFGLVHEGRKVLDIQWTGGKAAQQRLKSCASARQEPTLRG